MTVVNSEHVRNALFAVLGNLTYSIRWAFSGFLSVIMRCVGVSVIPECLIFRTRCVRRDATVPQSVSTIASCQMTQCFLSVWIYPLLITVSNTGQAWILEKIFIEFDFKLCVLTTQWTALGHCRQIDALLSDCPMRLSAECSLLPTQICSQQW